MVDSILALFADVEPGWRVFWLSMLPVTELRAAIPLGVAWGLSPFSALLWGISGNFVPIIPLLLVLRWLYRVAIRYPFFAKILNKIANHGKKNEGRVRRYGLLGLAVIVMIPLPGTGVWTGSLIAVLLGLEFWPALAAITLGEVLAGVIVSLLTSGVIAVSQFMYGEIILAVLVVAIVILYLVRRKRKS